MTRTDRVALLACLLLASASAQKQTASRKASAAAPDKLIALKVTGTKRYTEKEILAASGLQLGQNAADGDFKEAVKRLGDSGMFTDLAYSYTSANAGVKLELQLTDSATDQLVPARFENFVWFSDAELLRELQARVPLFQQVVPLTGTLSDRLAEALQALLNEKQIPARVDHFPEAAQEGGKVLSVAYSVEGMDIRIRDAEFPGAPAELLPALQTASRKLKDGLYVRGGLAKVAAADYLPVFLKSGHLKAAFAPAEARVVAQPSPPSDAQTKGEVKVDAIFPVVPGKVYAAAGVDWKGNSAITSGELAPLLHLVTGQPADAVRLTEDLRAVGKLYRRRGYMAARITPEARLDDAKSTVHYDIEVVEGPRYKMGDLEITGLDTQATAKMRAAWTLREGDPYNADYLKQFLEDTRQLLPRGVSWSIGTDETLEEKDKTVDVEIRFR